MGRYCAEVQWDRGEQDFCSGRYSRAHRLRFDGGLDIAGSSSPQVVPLPWSDPQAIDPEEAFVASIASCHMLWFLSIAAKQSLCVDCYQDHAEGMMTRNGSGKMSISRVTLRPQVRFSGANPPDVDTIHALHHQAHAECFIANSVRTEIICEPVLSLG